MRGDFDSNLFIRIGHRLKNGQFRNDYYLLTRMDEQEGERLKWEFVNAKQGKDHTVILHTNGVLECNCEDFNYRKQPHGHVCKHIESLLEQRLLPTPK